MSFFTKRSFRETPVFKMDIFCYSRRKLLFLKINMSNSIIWKKICIIIAYILLHIFTDQVFVLRIITLYLYRIDIFRIRYTQLEDESPAEFTIWQHPTTLFNDVSNDGQSISYDNWTAYFPFFSIGKQHFCFYHSTNKDKREIFGLFRGSVRFSLKIVIKKTLKGRNFT